jgi:hypothetical protein
MFLKGFVNNVTKHVFIVTINMLKTVLTVIALYHKNIGYLKCALQAVHLDIMQMILL